MRVGLYCVFSSSSTSKGFNIFKSGRTQLWMDIQDIQQHFHVKTSTKWCVKETPATWAPEEGCSSRVRSESVSVCVYVIHTAGAGEGLTLHRPPQHSGNDPRFFPSVPPKLQNCSTCSFTRMKIRQTKKIRKQRGIKQRENISICLSVSKFAC